MAVVISPCSSLFQLQVVVACRKLLWKRQQTKWSWCCHAVPFSPSTPEYCLLTAATGWYFYQAFCVSNSDIQGLFLLLVKRRRSRCCLGILSKQIVCVQQWVAPSETALMRHPQEIHLSGCYASLWPQMILFPQSVLRKERGLYGVTVFLVAASQMSYYPVGSVEAFLGRSTSKNLASFCTRMSSAI